MKYDTEAASSYIAGANAPVRVFTEECIGVTTYIVRCEDQESETFCYISTFDDYSDWSVLSLDDAIGEGLPV